MPVFMLCVKYITITIQPLYMFHTVITRGIVEYSCTDGCYSFHFPVDANTFAIPLSEPNSGQHFPSSQCKSEEFVIAATCGAFLVSHEIAVQLICRRC